MKKNKPNNSIKRLMILSTIIFLIICGFTYALGRGLITKKSMGLTNFSFTNSSITLTYYDKKSKNKYTTPTKLYFMIVDGNDTAVYKSSGPGADLVNMSIGAFKSSYADVNVQAKKAGAGKLVLCRYKNGKQERCTSIFITVYPENLQIKSVKPKASKSDICAGESLQYNVTTDPSWPPYSYSWSSTCGGASNCKNYYSLSTGGKISVNSNLPKTTSISVSAKATWGKWSKSGQSKLTAYPKVTSVTVPSSVYVQKGKCKDIKINTTPYSNYFTSKTNDGVWIAVDEGYNYSVCATGSGIRNGDYHTILTLKFCGGKTATMTVYVKDKPLPTKVTLKPSSKTIEVGETIELTYALEPTNSKAYGHGWRSNDTSVAKVDLNGKVTGIKAGKATITLIINNELKAQATITVKKATTQEVLPTKVILSSTREKIEVGETITLTAKVRPDNATNKKVIWLSSNTGVVTVDSNGKVTGRKAGTATIIATALKNKKVKATATIIVKDILPEYVVLYLHDDIEVGRPVKLKAKVFPNNATDKTVTWTSSNTSVATVDQEGFIWGHKAGPTKITVTTVNGKTDEVFIKVKKATTQEVLPTGVTLSPTSKTIEVNKTTTLTATVSPSNATNKTVTWTSSNTNVATVDSNGKVTGKKAGTATITAKTSNNKTATATIKVNAPVVEPSVTITPSSKTIDINEGVTLTAKVTPDDTGSESVTWTSSSPSVASVSSMGVVKGKKAGTAIITATSTNGKIGTARITVTSNIYSGQTIDVETIVITPASRTINVGSKLSLLAMITPSNATNKTVTWTSDDASVATVDSNGVVIGKKAGTVKIKATTVNGLKSESTITVKGTEVPPSPDPKPDPDPKPVVNPTSVIINSSNNVVEVNKTITLTATVSPSNATNKTVTWSSSNTNVATVSSNGVVTGKSVGTATITAKTSNGHTAISEITVKEAEIVVPPKPVEIPVDKIEIMPSTAYLDAYDTISLTAIISPQNATNKNVIWTSSDESIAKVDENGVVTGISSGMVEIIAQTEDGNKDAIAYITVNEEYSEDPWSSEEPSSYIQPIEPKRTSPLLVIGLVTLGLFVLGAISYFVIKGRNNYI